LSFGAVALPGIPEVRAGDDLAALLLAAGIELAATDVLCVAHKVVSKAEGRVRSLVDVVPGPRALELAATGDRDPRHVQAVLDEADEVVRATAGVLICRTRHGFVCANAGVDRSNTEPDCVVLLPENPDGSARALRAALGCAVVITDSFGRAWRMGQAEVAIGVAGLEVLDDWRGRHDGGGRELAATHIAVADQAASAADLARRKDSAEPAVRLRGLERFVLDHDGPGAAALVRARGLDLFR